MLPGPALGEFGSSIGRPANNGNAHRKIPLARWLPKVSGSAHERKRVTSEMQGS
jgi:hypothetical protein